MYQPEPRYKPSHREWGEHPAVYNDRLRREEQEFNEAHRSEQEADKRRFDQGMADAYGEEYPGQFSGW